MKSSFPPLFGDEADSGAATRSLTVAALNRLARETLEARFPLLWVSGEISNLTRAPSGHLYFTLKDADAQVRCTMWRNRAQLLPFRPENGMRVDARSLVSLYEARGEFQLNVEALRQAGQGNLFEAFLRLKDKLAAEGLFDTANKRELPEYPRRIGVVTSPAAAAWQDVLAALRRRASHIEVVLYPAPVQGVDASGKLAEAVRTAGARATEDAVDLLLLVRGGGSIEDLWAFNDETLARTVRECPIPVVSGVGHETDFTIADFAADVRAATPTGAAELATAGYYASRSRLDILDRMLSAAAARRLHSMAQRLDAAALRLVHPRERIGRARQGTEQLADRLASAMARRLERLASSHRVLELRLAARRPDLARATERCERLRERLTAAGAQMVTQRAARLESLATHLQHLAPQAVLARGYSITRDAGGRIVRSSSDVTDGGEISIELAKGRLRAIVNSTEA